MLLPEIALHNLWLKAVNGALQRDRLLTDKIRFGPLALNKQLVLNTWSDLLMDEASLPDDWMHEGVLVGIRPITDKIGIG
jgi:ribonuclease HI